MSHVDPGLNEPTQEAAQDVERSGEEKDETLAEKAEQDFLDPRLVES
jgi:potassium channel subfamily K, other eukaryote